MEINRKQKTLTGLFLKFAVLFCVNTVLIIIGCTVLLIGCSYLGVVLPANYAEIQLSENTPEIQAAGEELEKWIPKGCTYGVYDAGGEWKSGSFPKEEREAAWAQYEKESIYASTRKYYRFIRQNAGDVCIVKYDLYMKYSWEVLNDVLPAPEILSFVLDGVLFVLNAIFLSRHFAKQLRRQLKELGEITDKIAENNLEFETKPSDIREINEVMISLSQMKDALKASLKTQWDMEHQKQEQLAALAHDIKTPLTIIRGNAELMAEDELSAENKECTDYILSNADNIEQYLEHMKQVLHGMEPESDYKVIPCTQLGEMLRETAVQLAVAEKVPVSFAGEVSDGEINCSQTRILRAWNNILCNAIEYTDRERGIEVQLRQCSIENQEYLVAVVHDFGEGFTAKDLEYADKEFYSGDQSRHNRNHQGLGLAIAKRFLEEQGGFLKYGNHAGGGAEVSLWLNIQ